MPIMLRLALIENLRRVGARIAAGTGGPQSRRDWADQMLDVARARSDEPDPGDRRHGAVEPADGELVRRRARAPAAGPERRARVRRSPGSSSGSRNRRPDDRAAGAGRGPGAGRRPGVDQQHASAACASSASTDWREFVETMSVVEHTLREDPAGVYGRMDFATRDRYRHVVEAIAKRSGALGTRGGAQGDPARQRATREAGDGERSARTPTSATT